jgi:hypothetical protein
MGWATFRAIFSQTHLVTLIGTHMEIVLCLEITDQIDSKKFFL